MHFPVDEDLERAYQIVHMADFDFKSGFQANGIMRRIEWYYCVSGSGILGLDGREYELRANVMFCSGSPVRRAIKVPDDTHLQTIMFGCIGSEIEDILHEGMGGINTVFSPTNGDAVYNVAKAMLDVAGAFEPLADIICTQYLPVLMTTVRQGRIFDERHEHDNFTTYLKCKRYIDQHSSEIERVEDVALAFDISHEYMCRLFKRHSTFTPHAYLLRLKMNYALNRLQTGNDPIKSIAFSAGFSSSSAFSKAFKRIMGISPQFVRKSGESEK